MCEIRNLDPVSLWVETWPRAAKEHRCASCAGPIAIGTKYLRVFTVFDGYAGSARQCAECRSLSMAFSEAHGFKPGPDTLREFLEECVEEEGDTPAAERWKSALTEMMGRRGAP